LPEKSLLLSIIRGTNNNKPSVFAFIYPTLLIHPFIALSPKKELVPPFIYFGKKNQKKKAPPPLSTLL
jgi:hypothetical protein